MEITREILIQNDIDPALYSKDDLRRIGEAADSIANSLLPQMIAEIDKAEPDEDGYRADGDKAREDFNTLMAKINVNMDSVASLCSVKKSIFSGTLTANETDVIVNGTSELIAKTEFIRESAIDQIALMNSALSRLLRIQEIYNDKLYRVGLINVAATVLNVDTDELYPVIEAAFERFNSITEFINDLNDRAVICETAMEEKLPEHLSALIDASDAENRGARLNVQGVINAATATKVMITDVIER